MSGASDGPSPASTYRGADQASPAPGPSNDPDADPSSPQPPPGKKRKTAGPGSRGVANLTPEQLARKRANDREAQRAIRERNRQQIDRLQAEIAQLQSTDAFQELQKALRAKEEAELENGRIKKLLSGYISGLQALATGTPSGSPQTDAPIYPSPSQSAGPAPAQGHPPPPAPSSVHNVSTPSSAASPPGGDAGLPWHQQPQASVTSAASMSSIHGGSTSGTTSTTNQLLAQQHNKLRDNLDMGNERLGLDFLLDPSQPAVTVFQANLRSAQDTPAYRHVPMKHDWTVPQIHSYGPNTLPRIDPYYNSPHTQTPAPIIPTANTPAWALPLKHTAPTCPLDQLLLDFFNERRQRAAEGLPHQEIVGPPYPSVSSLLNPAHSRYAHPLSKFFTDILATFPDLKGLPDRIAVLYIMFIIMRWQISPTQEAFERIPAWARPTPAQQRMPHPAWIDHIPFPRMREKLLAEHGVTGRWGGGSSADGRDSHGGMKTSSLDEFDEDSAAAVAFASSMLYNLSSAAATPSSSLYPHQTGSGSADGPSAPSPPSGPAKAFPFDEFFIPFTTTLSVNWPYEDADALLVYPGSDEVLINPVFERHLCRNENWTLGDAFARAFPGLKGTFNHKRGSG